MEIHLTVYTTRRVWELVWESKSLQNSLTADCWVLEGISICETEPRGKAGNGKQKKIKSRNGKSYVSWWLKEEIISRKDWKPALEVQNLTTKKKLQLTASVRMLEITASWKQWKEEAFPEGEGGLNCKECPHLQCPLQTFHQEGRTCYIMCREQYKLKCGHHVQKALRWPQQSIIPIIGHFCASHETSPADRKEEKQNVIWK